MFCYFSLYQNKKRGCVDIAVYLCNYNLRISRSEWNGLTTIKRTQLLVDSCMEKTSEIEGIIKEKLVSAGRSGHAIPVEQGLVNQGYQVYFFSHHFGFQFDFKIEGSPLYENFSKSLNLIGDIDLGELDVIGGEIVDPNAPSFTPPAPSSPDGKTEGNFPFFDNAVSNSEVLNLDSMTDDQFNFMKDETQRGECGMFGGLLDYQKERYMKVMADKWDGSGIDVSYDSEKSAIVDFYDTNGLDTSLNYSFDYNDLGLGYKSETVYEGIYSDFKMGLGGEIKVSSEAKSKFLDPNLGSLIVAGNTASATGSITGGIPNINVGVPAVIALLASGQLDNLSEAMIDTAIGGFKASSKYATKLYSDFTNSGDRIKDIFNIGVQREAYMKGMSNVISGGATVADGKITVDTAGITFPKIQFEDWSFPSFQFPAIPDIGVLIPDIPNIGIDAPVIPDIGVDVPSIPNIGVNAPSIPDIGVDVPAIPNIGVDAPVIPNIGVDAPAIPNIGVDAPAIPNIKVDAPSIPDIGINVDGKSLTLDTTDAKVELDTSKADLPEPEVNPFIGLIPLIASFLAGEVLTKNVELGITSTGSADGGGSASQSPEGGLRTIEANMANYKVKDYQSVVYEGINDEPVDLIGRKLRAWQGLHSLNPNLDYQGVKDSSGNNLNLKKGLFPSLIGMGLGEFLRESMLSNTRTNIVSNILDEVRTREPEENNNNDDNKKNTLLGIKKILFPTEGEFESTLAGEFGDDFKEIVAHFLKSKVI